MAPDGTSSLVTRGILNLTHRDSHERPEALPVGAQVGATIELDATAYVFEPGHRIRLDVSSSNWPRLDVNPNTGEPIGRHTHQVVAEQAVYADAEHPSHVVLPVIPG